MDLNPSIEKDQNLVLNMIHLIRQEVELSEMLYFEFVIDSILFRDRMPPLAEKFKPPLPGSPGAAPGQLGARLPS